MLTKEMSIAVNKLEKVVEMLALNRITVIRAELKLANHGQAELRKELLTLHELLNDQVKDMKPNQTGNQHEKKAL